MAGYCDAKDCGEMISVALWNMEGFLGVEICIVKFLLLNFIAVGHPKCKMKVNLMKYYYYYFNVMLYQCSWWWTYRSIRLFVSSENHVRMLVAKSRKLNHTSRGIIMLRSPSNIFKSVLVEI